MRQAPQMRASHLKSNLESLADLGVEHEQAVRSAVADVVRQIEESSRVAWLPLELDLELTDAVDRHVGRERMKRWGREAIARSAQGPLLRPLMLGLQAMGLTPHTALKRAPYAWTLIYRGCGDLEYQHAGEREIVLVHDRVPTAMLRSTSYLHGIAGAFDGAIEIGGGLDIESEVEHDVQAKRAIYRHGWR
ncbi:MAG: hypothetical protein M3Y87_14465 [Myxococcota bacterium]|nr:hypothetical protein [Myxococcota bacterium]